MRASVPLLYSASVRASEVVGGLSLVGLGVLVGLSLMPDDEPEVITSPDDTFVFNPSDTTVEASTTTRARRSNGPATSEPPTSDSSAETSTDPPSTDSSSTDPPTSPPTTDSSSTTTSPPTTTATPVTIPQGERAAVTVRVLNGGAVRGAAQYISDVLRFGKFTPLGPADAPAPLDVTGGIVVYSPGREAEGRTVLQVLGYPPERLIPATPEDRNWEQFGDGLDALVILGRAE